jgi:hypothetical protein
MLRLVVGAFRLLAQARARRTTGSSVAIEDYPPRRHLEIRRGEPFALHFVGRRRREWLAEVPPLTVDDATRLAQLQVVVRSQVARLKAESAEQPEKLVALAATRVMFYRAFYSWIIRKAARTISWRKRRAFAGDARWYFEADEMRGHIIFDKLLKANSEIDSFFFDIPRVNGREIQPPNRDGWRAQGCRGDGARWKDILSTPVLEVYDLIVSELERDTVARMNRERREAERQVQEND